MSSSESFLVDLAVAIVKRRKLFFATFALVFTVGVGYQLMAAPTYQYVTLIKLAQNGEGDLLESSTGVITSIESQWLPQIGREFKEAKGVLPEFAVDVSDVSGIYILLSSVGTTSKGEEIDWVHSAVADRVDTSQSALENVAIKKLESQIGVAEEAVDGFQGASNSESSGAGLLETLVSLKGRLAGMQSAETRVIAQRKDKALGLSLPIRIALMVLQAFFAAVLVVLFYYFVQRVSSVLGGREKSQ